MDKTGHPPSVFQIDWFIKIFSLPPTNKTHLFVSPSLYPITTLSLLNEVLSGLNGELVSIVKTTLLSLGPVQSVKSQLEFCSVLKEHRLICLLFVCLFSFSQRYDFLKRATISSVIRKRKNCCRSVSLFIIWPRKVLQWNPALLPSRLYDLLVVTTIFFRPKRKNH